jgi:hypothetical protein
MQPRRRPRELALFGDGEEIPQVTQFHREASYT